MRATARAVQPTNRSVTRPCHRGFGVSSGLGVSGTSGGGWWRSALARWRRSSAQCTWSHSLKDLQAQLGDREKYFQPIDKDAPAFMRQDADGHSVSLADFRGKVVVLNFIYTNCPDICPLHAERIAEIQGLVSQSPMKQQ